MTPQEAIDRCERGVPDKGAFWSSLINTLNLQHVAEIGVWKGEFAETLLRACPGVTAYTMVDPWRHLDAWNQSYNLADEAFTAVYNEALRRTDFASDRRRILRGTTTEVSNQIGDESLDLAYIDGDHGLRGVLIDLVRLYPKVRDGGILGGDDFKPVGARPGAMTNPGNEPAMVYPVAAVFAEAVGCEITALPHNQFAIVIDRSRAGFGPGYRFRERTGRHWSPALRDVLGTLIANE